MRFSLLRIFLYFRKWHFLTPSLKNSLGEHFRVLYHCFFRCFHFTTGFYYCFWVFLFLIAFASLFLQAFLFHQWFYYCFSSVFFSPIFFTITAFCQLLRFCVVVLQVRELFLLSCIFYLTLLSDIWHNLLSSRLP